MCPHDFGQGAAQGPADDGEDQVQRADVLVVRAEQPTLHETGLVAVRIMASGRMTRLKNFVEFFQGEVNQTVATSKGFLTDREQGTLVMRGANISLYQLRQASQGEDIFLNVKAFLVQ